MMRYMVFSGKINEFVKNGSEANLKSPFQGTGPFARLGPDLSVGANTPVALAGPYRVLPARAKASPLPRPGDAQRSTLDPRNSRGSISLRRALLRRYCPTCRPNQQNTPESVAAQRIKAALSCPGTFNTRRWLVCCKILPKNHYLTLAAQRGGQADTETVTAERHSQGLIANT